MEYLVPERQPRRKDIAYIGRASHNDASFPPQIDTSEELDAFIATRLSELQESQIRGYSQDKLAFLVIHYCKLTPTVIAHLRKKFLPSFSKITWSDVYPFFSSSLDTSMYSDHRSIQTYPLCRSRIPIEIFEDMARQLDRSRKNLGERRTLKNETAVQLYMNPIPETILSLFYGRLVNMPEHMLHGRMAGSRRCEFSITFHGRLTLLFIEVKHELSYNPREHSKMIAQVMAEADGAKLFNKEYQFDDIPIRAILTDGVGFEFYFFDFKTWSIQRGIGSPQAGIPDHTYPRILLPIFETDRQYAIQLKVIVEVIFDEFIDSYIVGLENQMEHSAAELSSQVIGVLGRGVIRRESTGYWEQAFTKAKTAGRLLREAHYMRVQDPFAADELAQQGISCLKESALLIPHSELDWSLLDNWDERELAVMTG